MEIVLSSSKRGRTQSSGTSQAVTCMVDGCTSDLSKCRDYHRRHKVCETHSKTPCVTIRGHQQRFCQQCSRFHALEEFDEGKRSCRKRLEGHNRRRRKPQPEPLPVSPPSFLSTLTQGNSFSAFSNQPMNPAATTYPMISPTSSWAGFQYRSSISTARSYSDTYEDAGQFPFQQGPESPLVGSSSSHQHSALSLLSSSSPSPTDQTLEMGLGRIIDPSPIQPIIGGSHYNNIRSYSVGQPLEGQSTSAGGGSAFFSYDRQGIPSISPSSNEGSSAIEAHKKHSFSWE